MDVVLTLVGIAVAVVGLCDMNHGLLHPSGRGAVSRRVPSGIWGISKLIGRRFGPAVGSASRPSRSSPT